MFLKNLSKLPCVRTVLKMRRWKLLAEKSALLTFGRNHLKKKKRKKKEKFIRKRSDDVFDNMGRESIIENLQKLNEVQSIGLNLETNYFRNRLTSLEKSRHLMCWHDGSTSDGHGYIVITISVMFDVAASFSDEEFLLKYGENVCIQPVVEKSSLYIIGRCPSNDQQLLDSDIHLQDISLFRETLET